MEGTNEVMRRLPAAEAADVRWMLFCSRKRFLLNGVYPTVSVTTVGLTSVTEDRTVLVPEYRVM
jgi:hypothetical protein